MRLGLMMVGKGRWGNGQVECFGVGVGNIDGVLQVHLKCIAMPAKMVFDERCQELGMVMEIPGYA